MHSALTCNQSPIDQWAASNYLVIRSIILLDGLGRIGFDLQLRHLQVSDKNFTTNLHDACSPSNVSLNTSVITPRRYGLLASPNACEAINWKASAEARLVGSTTY